MALQRSPSSDRGVRLSDLIQRSPSSGLTEESVNKKFNHSTEESV